MKKGGITDKYRRKQCFKIDCELKTDDQKFKSDWFRTLKIVKLKIGELSRVLKCLLVI